MRKTRLSLAIGLAITAAATPILAEEGVMEEVVVMGRSTIYANNAVSDAMMQQQNPITSSLSLIDTLPGISIQEGDTYGFDDWSTTISMRGFQVSLADQQLGITIDGLPNGNSNYGGGAKANRYIDNENVLGVNVSQGTADVGSLSNEALGGTLDFLTADPSANANVRTSLTSGEFGGRRYFVRYDTGALFGGETYAWVSASHQEASDWVDQSAENERDHIAAKVVSDFSNGRFTGYVAFDDTHEDNYQRLFSPNDFRANPESDQLTAEWTGIPYVDQLYRRGWSTLRENFFTYGKLEYDLNDALTVSGAVYYHDNWGRGDWVPPYIVDVAADGAGNPESELTLGEGTVYGGSALGLLYGADANGVALSAIDGCVSSITFPYGGTGPQGDPSCYPQGNIPLQSYRHTHYAKSRTGFTGDLEWQANFGDADNTLRAGIWVEDYLREEYRDWHKIIDTRVGFEFDNVAYWVQYDREYPQDTFKWYVEDTVDLGAFSLSLGAKQFLVDLERNDKFGETSDVAVDSDSDVLFSGGIIFRTPVDGLELFAGYSENFSAISDNILERPDSNLANLEPETAENIDIGVRYDGNRLKLSATYYDIQFDNRIIFLAANTSAGPDYLIGTNGSYFNAGGIDADGIELSASVDVTPEINFYFSYTNNSSQYLGTGDPLVDSAVGIVPGNDVVNMPETMFNVSGDWQRGAFRAGFNTKFTDDRFVDVANTWTAESYTVTDIYIGYAPQNLPSMLNGLNVNFVVNNVADKSYLGGISGGGAWIGAPRTAAITLTLDLDGEN